MWFIFFPLLHSWVNGLFFVYHHNLSYQLFEAMAVLKNTKKHLSYKDTSGGFEEPNDRNTSHKRESPQVVFDSCN